jgi:hypothetical protein
MAREREPVHGAGNAPVGVAGGGVHEYVVHEIHVQHVARAAVEKPQAVGYAF